MGCYSLVTNTNRLATVDQAGGDSAVQAGQYSALPALLLLGRFELRH